MISNQLSLFRYLIGLISHFVEIVKKPKTARQAYPVALFCLNAWRTGCFPPVLPLARHRLVAMTLEGLDTQKGLLTQKLGIGLESNCT